MILDLRTRQVDPGITVFELAGRLTLGNRLTEVEHTIRNAIQNGCRKMVIDLGGLEHLDSAGVGMLVMCAGTMEQAGGRMRVSGANARLTHVFDITHLDRVMPIDADADAACRGLAP